MSISLEEKEHSRWINIMGEAPGMKKVLQIWMDILSDWPLYSMCSLNLANRSLYLKEYQENKDIRYLLLEYFKMKKYWKQCLFCYINQTIWVCFPYWLMSSIYIKKEKKHARLSNSQSAIMSWRKSLKFWL